MASIVQKSPKMIPNTIASDLVHNLMTRISKAFEEGLIQNSYDWGIVAAHLHAFAHYMDEGGECGIRNALFEEGLRGDAYRPALSMAITEGWEEVWDEMVPTFMAQQKGES